MKKFLMISLTMSLLCIGVAKAQVTGTTNVHVKLVDVLALSVNNSDVNINFNNAADYQNGVSVPMAGHLTVTSNQPYTLNIKAAGNLAGTGANTDVLDPSILTIALPTTGNNTALGATPTTVGGLATTNAALITNASPGLLKLVDVNYSVPSSISTTSAILGKKADTYTTTVTYTITQ
ncbi:hypothetical protein [Mucilaginibacter agri]|uniref:Peptidoglycan-binding protein LysM n=1 Tax=Mucilaginibacter agri TaxID=2695265 RepID=A0A966DUU5_9SPHI|nr:hypothetical protein [Mucilaginibacter agri]NCD72145.1 hypothetical protein [Mucilaginibacter agri]